MKLEDFISEMIVDYIDTQDRVDALVDIYSGKDTIYLDFETSGLDSRIDIPWLLGIKHKDSEVVHLIDTYVCDILPLKEVIEASTVVGANLSFDLKYLRTAGIRPRRVWDVVIMSRMLTAGKSLGYKQQGETWKPIMVPNDLSSLCDRNLGFRLIKDLRKDFILHPQLVSSMKRRGVRPTWDYEHQEYAASDVYVLEDIVNAQKKEIAKEGLEKIAAIENRCVPVVSDIEYDGVYVDKEMWLHISDYAELQMKMLYGEIAQHFSKSVNKLSLFPDITGSLYDINLESQADVINGFKSLGIDIPNTKKNTIKKLAHPVAKLLLDYRAQQKRNSTYGTKWIAKMHPITGRIHTSFNQIVDTGRFSSNDPR